MSPRKSVARKVLRAFLPIALILALVVLTVGTWLVYDITRPPRAPYLVTPKTFEKDTGMSLSKATDAADYGLALGTAQTFAGISRLLAPLLATALFDYFSPSLPFFVAAGIAALGCMLTFRIQSHRPNPAPVAAMVDF